MSLGTDPPIRLRPGRAQQRTFREVLRDHWCRRGESNPRPRDYETLALPLSYAGLNAILYATDEPAKVSRCSCASKRMLWRSCRMLRTFRPDQARSKRRASCLFSRYQRVTNGKAPFSVVLPYHPTWDLGTLAATRIGTLCSLLSEAIFSPVRRKPG